MQFAFQAFGSYQYIPSFTHPLGAISGSTFCLLSSLLLRPQSWEELADLTLLSFGEDLFNFDIGL